ncbi:MAG: glycoside hydrolase family 2, partial [Christensenellaceae bacterium]|nr:glycoside hydrolase family 2 [Christensenellaceae bacterium]
MNKLYTTEGEELLKNNNIPWNTYPRPQLVRESFYNLNGSWDFAETENSELPKSFPEKILVPFAPQSLLSGIARNIPEEHFLFYRKSFRLPEEMHGKRIILHIGAADQTAAVFLNKKYIGEHEGGYESFSFDITDDICKENELVIRVFDHLSEKRLPYGKQSAKRGGMWYTPISGIWQTVWIEAVPENYIRSISIETGMNFATIRTEGIDEGKIFLGEEVYPIKNGEATIHFDEPHLWSPEDPYLYSFRIEASEDKIQSYFALRSLSVKKINGKMRLCLNEKPYFFHGILDQGYFSDGIFTPADPVLFEKDILAMKKLGFN